MVRTKQGVCVIAPHPSRPTHIHKHVFMCGMQQSSATLKGSAAILGEEPILFCFVLLNSDGLYVRVNQSIRLSVNGGSFVQTCIHVYHALSLFLSLSQCPSLSLLLSVSLSLSQTFIQFTSQSVLQQSETIAQICSPHLCDCLSHSNSSKQ